MANKLILGIKPYIQPFERRLALLELQALAGYSSANGTGADKNQFISLNTDADLSLLVEKLAYWQEILPNALTTVPTRQALVESVYERARSGKERPNLISKGASLANRRVLRYASHGIHEYRGKFFPQLVGALLNIAGADSRSVVIDPMCGSGTTLAEATIRGHKSFGIDLNPLSVLISRSKCGVLTLSEKELSASESDFSKWLHSKEATGDGDLEWLSKLPGSSQTYLSRWFSPRALLALDVSIRYINRISSPRLRDFYTVCLSNILRSVSYQRESDLRVRREDAKEIPPVPNTLNSEIQRNTRAVCSFLSAFGKAKGKATVLLGDARDASRILSEVGAAADVCITSPPYATALPYLDTDRLSLYYLDLCPRADHRSTDLRMIGNREITNGHRTAYLDEYTKAASSMPRSITDVISQIDHAYKSSQAGFRRKNLSALLAKYFMDMKEVLGSTLALLKPRAHTFVVVGNNHTVVGSDVVEIRTPELLGQLSEMAGFTLEEIIPMELLISRDIFRKNGGTRECLLVLRKSG